MTAFLLTAAFVAVELLGVYAYWPQIKELLAKKSNAENFHPGTWGLWGLGGIIASAYAIFVNEDPYLIFVVTADTIGMLIIFALACRARTNQAGWAKLITNQAGKLFFSKKI